MSKFQLHPLAIKKFKSNEEISPSVANLVHDVLHSQQFFQHRHVLDSNINLDTSLHMQNFESGTRPRRIAVLPGTTGVEDDFLNKGYGGGMSVEMRDLELRKGLGYADHQVVVAD